jgi:hypothetical protein
LRETILIVLGIFFDSDICPTDVNSNITSLTGSGISDSSCSVTSFAQPHILMYMFCPYVISTLYHLLEELQMRTFKRFLFFKFFSQLYT